MRFYECGRPDLSYGRALVLYLLPAGQIQFT
jgi:hypothetical protein